MNSHQFDFISRELPRKYILTVLLLGASTPALAVDTDSDGLPDTASWVQLGSDIDGEAADDYSGGSVALSSNGNIMAIGAYGNDSASGTDTRHGHVRILSWEQIGSGSCLAPLTNSENYEWWQIGQDIDGEAAGDYSGWSVALSADGNVVAVVEQSIDAAFERKGRCVDCCRVYLTGKARDDLREGGRVYRAVRRRR